MRGDSSVGGSHTTQLPLEAQGEEDARTLAWMKRKAEEEQELGIEGKELAGVVGAGVA